MSEKPPLLETRNLQVSTWTKEGGEWRENQIVKGVSLKLEAGQVLGLIGESGAGKSTIGLAALLYGRGNCGISGGQVLLDGADITTCRRPINANCAGDTSPMSPNRRRRLSIPPIAGRPVIGNIANCTISCQEKKHTREWSRFSNKSACRNRKLLAGAFRIRPPAGQLQRAMTTIGVNLSSASDCFDEPTTALDVTTQLDVLAAIKRMIKEKNTAALYISHDLAVVSQIADDILVLRHGKAVEAAQTMTLIEPRAKITPAVCFRRTTPASKQRRLPIRKNRYWNCAMSQPPTETANGGVQCQRLAISRADFGRSRRIRQRQVHHGQSHHRAFTAFRRQILFLTASRCRLP